MTLDQLRVFVAIADALHVTRAAAALGLTQSAASAALAALEERHGVILFNRVGRHVELTTAGRLFLVEAKAVLDRAGQAEAVLDDLSGLRRGRISLFASQTIAGYWLPRWLDRYRRRHPDIAVSVGIGNTAAAVRAVLEGGADLGLIEGAATESASLLRLAVPGDRLIMVVAPDHPFAGATAITPDDLRALSWVLREPGSGTRQMFESALATLGIDPAELTVSLELPSNEAVRSAVEAGAGATVISHLVADGGLRAGTLSALPLPLPARDFTLIRHRDRHRSRALAAFLSLVEADSDSAHPPVPERGQ